jgi:hypothetical protein
MSIRVNFIICYLGAGGSLVRMHTPDFPTFESAGVWLVGEDFSNSSLKYSDFHIISTFNLGERGSTRS